MAKTKYIIVSDCREDGKVHKKGSLIELDLEDPKEGQRIAVLNRAGRIGLATKENIEAIQAEIKADIEREKKFEETLRRNSGRAAVPA